MLQGRGRGVVDRHRVLAVGVGVVGVGQLAFAVEDVGDVAAGVVLRDRVLAGGRLAVGADPQQGAGKGLVREPAAGIVGVSRLRGLGQRALAVVGVGDCETVFTRTLCDLPYRYPKLRAIDSRTALASAISV